MSQHTFESSFDNKKADIMFGWDRPLQRFFAVVTFHYEDGVGFTDEFDEDEYFEGIIYSNLDDKELSNKPELYHDISYFKNKVESLGIKIPDGLIEAVNEDKNNDVGNREVFYGKT